MQSVERFCDRAMLIERGRVVNIGDPRDIARAYEEVNFGSVAHESATDEDAAPARILDGWCEDAAGTRITSQRQGERCRACMEVAFDEAVENPSFAITFRNDVRHTIFVARSDREGPTGPFAAGDKVVVSFAFDDWLAPSHYTLTPSLAVPALGPSAVSRIDDVSELAVEAGHWSGGVADFPHELQIRSS